MIYFDDLYWRSFAHDPAYSSWIDRVFPGFYALNYAHSGKIWFQGPEEARPRLVKGPVAWVTWPGVRFRYGGIGGNLWDHRYVTFRGPRAEALHRGGLLEYPFDFFPVAITKPEPFRMQFDEMQELLRKPDHRLPRAAHLLEGLLLEVKFATARQKLVDPLVEDLVQLAGRIDREPDKDWDFHGLARDRGVSYSHFRHLFREIHTLAPQQYLIRARLALALTLLKSPQMTIKEVCRKAGFPDEKQFARLFRSKYQTSPSTYYREARKVPKS